MNALLNRYECVVVVLLAVAIVVFMCCLFWPSNFNY